MSSVSFNNAFGSDWLNSIQGFNQIPISVADTGPLPIAASPLDLGPLPDPSSMNVGGMATPSWGGQKLGLNMGTANLALNGLQTIAGLWGAFQAAKLAKKQFNFTKEVTNTNLNNQIKSYNTMLADRSRSRGVVEGQTQAQVDQYINDNKATRG